MGCKQSKEAVPVAAATPSAANAASPPLKGSAAASPPKRKSSTSSNKASERDKVASRLPTSPAALYHHLLNGLSTDPNAGNIVRARTQSFWNEAKELCASDRTLASYADPNTRGTPLHVACSLGSSQLDDDSVGNAAIACIKTIIDACPEAVSKRDSHNHVPIEGIFSGIFVSNRNSNGEGRSNEKNLAMFYFRSEASKLLLECDPESVLLRGKNLYKIIEALPDDFETPLGPTAEFVQILGEKGGASAASAIAIGAKTPSMSGIKFDEFVANPEDDDVLSLLYRRFVRQFDQSERFFEGDNSREEVVQHREKFKNAAVNTFNIIELLLRRPYSSSKGHEGDSDLLVHNAVRVGACPPDLLRYIVETNLDSVGEPDSQNNLPLHYAAGNSDSDLEAITKASVPESYSKYLIDELLYAFPDGAAVPNSDGVLPIVLAIESGKKWIGGGVRSLYEAYPAGLADANLGEDHPIVSAMSFVSEDDNTMVTELQGQDDEEGTVATGVDGGGGRRRKRSHRKKINKDESHDAIMFVQKPDSSVRDVVSTMCANEEDGGVQMLGCAALGKAATEAGLNGENNIASVALMGVSAVVNAMKNHPNEPAVQERACTALAAMAPADGVREVSFAASGAISTVVSAMQAHVSDATVQKEACIALRGIAAKGGAERATVVASVSGFTALVNAMGAHPDDRDVQREACLAMEVLTSFPDAYLPKIQGQAEPLLQAAAEKFPEDCLKPAMAVRERLL